VILTVHFCVRNGSDLYLCNFNDKVNSAGLFYGHADPISVLYNLLFRVCFYFSGTVKYIPSVNNLSLCPSEVTSLFFPQKLF
jgi:hypothetical protein